MNCYVHKIKYYATNYQEYMWKNIDWYGKMLDNIEYSDKR